MATRKHRIIPYGAKIVTGGIGSELAKLFRKILADNGVDAMRYNDLMYWYIVKEQAKANRNERVEARMGLNQELMKEAITWKTFIKGLKFLHVEHFEIDIIVTFSDNRAIRLILKSQLSLYEHPGEILGVLYKQLQEIENDDAENHERRLDAYIEKTRGKQSKKDKAAARASLNKELQKTVMSWRTFVKGLVFHDCVRYGFNLTLMRRMKPPSTSTVLVNLDDYQDTTDDGDE